MNHKFLNKAVSSIVKEREVIT